MTWEHKDKVAVVGVGYSPLTRRSPRTLASLTVEACDAALADAGLARSDIDGIGTNPTMPRYGGEKGVEDGVDVVTPGFLARELGLAGQITWECHTQQMVTVAVMEAVEAIATGRCRYAIVYRALHMPVGRYSDFSKPRASGMDQFYAPYGFTMPAAWAGAVFNRYLHLSGATRESMANFVVQNRDNAHRNPNAFFRDTPLAREEYLAGRFVAEPMTMFDCDIPVDGAVAMVLTSRERARDLQKPGALISGAVLSSHPGVRGVPFTLEALYEGGAQLGQRLWAAAGIGPAEISAAELYDGFSIFVWVWLEALGFCGKGEAFRFIDDGRTRNGGEFPINTSGCSLAEGRVHGMAQMTEAALQVMGRAGARQVPRAAHVVATISNGIGGSTAFVFSRDAR